MGRAVQMPQFFLGEFMRYIGVDTETHLIRPGRQFPPLVCVSYATQSSPSLHPRGHLDAASGGLGKVSGWFRDPQVTQVFHNAKFDLGVFMSFSPSCWKALFYAVSRGRVACTLIREKLLNNYAGKLQTTPRIRLAHETVGPYSLAGLVHRYFDVDISEGKREDSWRLRFQELDGVPLDEWPSEAIEYAEADAVWTLRVYRAQENRARMLNGVGLSVFDDESRRVQADLALGLMTAWGVQVDGHRVNRVEAELRKKVSRGTEILKELWLLSRSGSVKKKAMQELVVASYQGLGVEIPKTDKGAVKTDRETLLGSGHEGLMEYARLGKYRTLLNTFIPAIRLPAGHPIHPSYNVMVATGRTSASRPNVQNIPRESGEIGIRECFVPRLGRVFVACDYDTAELRTLAQVLKDKVGYSNLADAYARDPGLDPHVTFARSMVGEVAWQGMTASEKKQARTQAKAASFGFPGGLGIATFRKFAAGYGLNLSVVDAKRLKKSFLLQWPELDQYFAQNGAESFDDEGLVHHARSGRYRGGCTYTQMCNTPFQGAAASGALNALFKVSWECYCDESSPLFESRPILFIHDEIVLSVPENRCHDAAMRLQTLMVEGMMEFTPDVPAQASPVAMRRWSKKAEPVLVAGQLVPWDESPQEDQTLCV